MGHWRGYARGRASLRTWQFQAAKAGNTKMLIWLGKQLLGQKDTSKVEQTGPDGRPVQHQVAVTLSDAEREQVKAFLGC